MEWIEDNNQKRIGSDSITIQTKTKLLYNHLKIDTCTNEENFNASNGWLERFKQRYKLHNIKYTGKATSANDYASLLFVGALKLFFY